MSDMTVAFLALTWIVIQLVGTAFTLANYRRFRRMLRIAEQDPDEPQLMLIARGHLRPEIERLIVFGFFLLVGFSVVIRQSHWITRNWFDLLFYGGLEIGALVLALKAVNVWRETRHFDRIDGDDCTEEKDHD